MEFLGKTVTKEFKGYGVLSGTVESYDTSSGFFEIVYEDGDSEELEFSEIASLLDGIVGPQPRVSKKPSRVARKPKKRRRFELLGDSELFDEHRDGKNLAVSDNNFSQELQFQEAIMASLISSQNSNCAASRRTIQKTRTSSNPELVEIDKEVCETLQIFCEICMERKESHEMFRVESCSHTFCSDCISRHVEVKIQDKVHVVMCPSLNCKGILDIDICKTVISKDVTARWEDALCESLILGSHKFYCPFKDCSALMVNDTAEVIRESECPTCRRLFCAQCRVPWHSGVECTEFQKLNVDERGREDFMLKKLARKKKWMRCPSCKFYVEKNHGCLHITCRCGFQFCYRCGAQWTETHGGCQRP